MGIEVTKFWEIESNKKTNRFIFISSGNPSGKYYILEQQRERTLVKEQIYSDTDNLKFLKLVGLQITSIPDRALSGKIN